MQGKAITYWERQVIERMLDDRRPVLFIAEKLGLSRAAIYKEIKRGTNPRCRRYSADIGQKVYVSTKNEFCNKHREIMKERLKGAKK